MSSDMLKVTIDGSALSYADLGSGPRTVVMLHGGGPGSSGASNFAPCLAFFDKRVRVLMIDQPGFGRSELPSFEGSYLDMSAERVLKFMDQLGIDRADLVGNSLGGGVALSVARDHPDRVGGLVLMNPAGAEVPLLALHTAEMGMIRDYYSGSGPSLERIREFAHEMVNNPSALPPELIEERYRNSLLPGAEKAMRAAARTFDPLQAKEEARDSRKGLLWTQLQDILAPTLLMWGREDRAAPLDRAIFLEARLPNAHLYVFPNCGHWIQIERPEAFAGITLQFLESLGEFERTRASEAERKPAKSERSGTHVA